MNKQIAILCFIVFQTIFVNAQNQANVWYFERTNGLDFNSGYPQYLGDCPDWVRYTTSISDTNGNLLFYTNGETVWNKDLDIMQNGTDLEGNTFNRQPAVICEDPGNRNRYYLFTAGTDEVQAKGLAYNIIDMTMDGGRGAVVVKNSRIQEGAYARHKITAVRKSNSLDYWIVTRLSENPSSDTWACFSITSAGVNPIPVLSPAIGVYHNMGGPVKVSQDRKKLISVQTNNLVNTHGSFEVCDFNAETGEIYHKFYIKEYPGCSACFGIYGMEISPDSKLVYVAFDEFSVDPNGAFTYIYQYDLTESDSLSFLNSRLIVSLDNNVGDLQLGPDGKIYASSSGFDPLNHRYLGVINDVWKKGVFCNFQKIAVDLGPQNNGTTLPSFPSELLYRFVWQGGPCAKTPFTFRHRFIPEPDSIVWDFADGTTSTDFNPTHVFQSGGNYEVHAHVVYPDGRIEETSREVEVLAAPEPWLGNDTLICVASTLQLDAGAGFTQYVWNEQFPPGNQYYTVTDTGYYRVRVKNDFNCYGYDTLHIALYPPVFLDTSQAEISNTTCSNSTGAIRGIQASPAAVIEWRDGSGNLVGSTIDISGLPVGNYYLTVIDTTGCITEIPTPFTINNIDSDLIIESAVGKTATCGQNNGSIQVETSVFGDLLLFSSDDGNTWEDNLGNFINLPAGPYMIRVKDTEGCEAVYTNNPVWVNDAGGPVVTFAGSTAATGSNADGTITVIATGDSLYYQLNGGMAQDTGYFVGLAPDVYYVTITDKYGCDTTIAVTVIPETGYQLSAVAGSDRKCLKKQAVSELKVSNLNGVKDFKAIVLYNSLLLDCIGYDGQFHDDLTVTEFTGRIELEWHGAQPLALSDTVSLVHLIFETRQMGVADVNWDMSGSSYFKDENGLNIPCTPVDGNIMISDPPVVVTNGDQRLCEGAFAVISGDAFLGVPPYTHEWMLPDGTTFNESSIWLFGVGTQNAGEYIVKVTDQYNCVVKDTVILDVIPPPAANFPATNPTQDTIPFEQSYLLEATPGFASYEWNTGDTTYYINVTEEGEYSVIIQTSEGCTDTSAVMMVNTWFPIQVPNAFTPNDDGLNDVFRPVVDAEQVRQFNMSIYNRWGQLFFETSDPSKGWDGKDEPAGVYNWVITYSNVVGKVFKLKGSVALVK